MSKEPTHSALANRGERAIGQWVPPESKAERFQALVESLFERIAEETQVAYRADLLRFSRFLGESDSVRGAARFLSLGKADADAAVVAFQKAMHDAGLSNGTINRRVAPIRTIVGLGRRAELIAWELEVPQLEKQSVKQNLKGPGVAVLQEVIANAKAAAATGSPKSVRDFAILRMLTDLGLRRGAITSSVYENLDRGTKQMRLRLKGGKWSVFTLPSETYAVIDAWLRLRGDDPGPVFFGVHPGSKRKPLTGRSVFRVIQGLAKNAGYTIHPHAIRHTSITAVIQSAGLRAGQYFARHKKSSTTEIYDDSKEVTGDAAAARLAGIFG